ncbi:hypothetical protein DPMN_111732 [Dreissena polymorpha]|uniref:Uncharacterized protein n=1 Tax=Dreissena polymorpha TaxID=45954 RepID=A0A9D4KF79_DREPO|nr:hypothetical protein DPMN_111732 [Dreissena polymorpha]
MYCGTGFKQHTGGFSTTVNSTTSQCIQYHERGAHAVAVIVDRSTFSVPNYNGGYLVFGADTYMYTNSNVNPAQCNLPGCVTALHWVHYVLT